MAAVRPARFPHYSRLQVVLQNLLAIRRPVLQLNISTDDITLSLGPINKPPDLAHLIALSVGNARAWLVLDDAMLGVLTAPWGGGDDDLPPVLQDAMLSAALHPLLKEFRTLIGARVSLHEGVSAPPEQSLPLGLWESSAMAGQPSAVFYLDTATATQLISSLEDRRGAENTYDWSAVALEFTLNAGQARVTMQELAALENGDIVLFPASITASTHEVILNQGQKTLAAGQIDGCQLIINRLLEANMPDHSPSNAEATQNIADPEALEITLRFDLGQLTLPFSELQKIQPGYSFELDLPAPGEVRILAGSQLIGRGELVQIEDRLGVRVSAVFKPEHV